MKIIPLSSQKKAIKNSFEVLKKGGVIIYPTDTLYGIGADGTNKKAILKIKKIKKRKNQFFSVILPSINAIEEYAFLDKKTKKILKKLLPGPYTFIFKSKRNFYFSKQNTIGVRIPDNKFCLALSKLFKKPIISTSANLSGAKNNYSLNTIEPEIKQQVDLIIDGKTKYKLPSTIYSFVENKILREGAGLKKLKKILKLK
jgi:L-threonylcarbamoyladenylate synthase